MKKLIYISFIFLLSACGGENGGGNNPTNPDDFKRKEMLTFWANHIIVPAYSDFNTKTVTLKESVDAFLEKPTIATLNTARDTWKNAYISWQKVAIFQVGKAQELNMVNRMNTVPTNVENLKKYATPNKENKVQYNLESPNLYAVQGFPALDYLLNGQGTDIETITFYTTAKNAVYFKNYLNDITKKIADLTKTVIDDWNGGYKELFIAKDGYTDVSSVDKLVNFYVIPFYEKELRDNKIATPSGARSGTIAVEKVEAYYYQKELSKELFTTALTATKNFYKGIGYDKTSGKSLHQYLEFLNRKDLATLIDAKFTAIQNSTKALNTDFASQIKTDKTPFLNTYDKMQSLLKSFKPDMMSALSIKNTSTDADND
ncbi:imelysin family protein [Tenacibaculum piscium]|uniref:imelysin family protein n=1 Tax=Tenacibaculum piscium TaxID=1458515 RepID=UPI001F2D2CCF|nr:imelysin family protein [Tenacibaculum piscium]MCG8182362.1 imelysin family protein [Tenacibaculum piscium]MCG8203754.1 imelysin family protein [Tenacibaculum piscium]